MKKAGPVLAVLVLAACSTEGKVTSVTGTSVPLPPASTWALSVHGCPQAAQCEDVRTNLAGRLIGAGLAERIVGSGQPADRSLDVSVTKVRSVSGVERVFLGAIAGRNEVSANDTLTNRNGQILRTFKVESASAAHPFSGESGLPDAYRQFAADTVSALR